MIFARSCFDRLSQASYLVGDEGSGEAVVVDPRPDVTQYSEYAVRHFRGRRARADG